MSKMMYSESMIKTSSTQKGSAHVVIIVILVIALVGVLGFVFWQNFMQKSDDKKSTDQSTSKTTDQNAPKTETVTIDEYGVKLTVPSGSNVKHESRQIGEAAFIAFTTQRVVDLGGDCAKGYPFGDLVTLSRDHSATSTEYDVHTTAEIGGYYYHIGTIEKSGLTPPSTCIDNDLAKTDEAMLVQALKGLTAKN